MRDDFIQRQLMGYHKKLKVLKQWQAEAEEITDPVRRAARQQTLRFEIRQVEKQIDEIVRRV